MERNSLDMKNNFKTQFIILLAIFVSDSLQAGTNYYKNILIGGRASTMGGAYIAISDDASGVYYNPAGLSLTSGNSISGSAKIFNQSQKVYANAIGSSSWNRENSNLFANFFGMIKRTKRHIFAFSFSTPDSTVEHQDQVFKDITDVVNPISIYGYNRHYQDSTDIFGVSHATKLSRRLSYGLSLFYSSRVKRETIHTVIEYADGEDEMSFTNETVKEKGVKPKLGFLWSPGKRLSVGMTLSGTFLFDSLTERQLNFETKGSSNNQMETQQYTAKRNMPYELSLGIGYFPSAYLLMAFDFDYFMSNDDDKKDVFNLSWGGEYYLNKSNALRFGVYTNRTNNLVCSSVTTSPNDDTDMYGVTIGYATFSRDSSVTFGAIYSMGSGDAQIYSGSTTTRSVEKSSISFVTSANYGF